MNDAEHNEESGLIAVERDLGKVSQYFYSLTWATVVVSLIVLGTILSTYQDMPDPKFPFLKFVIVLFASVVLTGLCWVGNVFFDAVRAIVFLLRRSNYGQINSQNEPLRKTI